MKLNSKDRDYHLQLTKYKANSDRKQFLTSL